MRPGSSRGLAMFAALAVTVFGQETTPAANPHGLTATMTPVAPTLAPAFAQEAPPRETGSPQPEREAGPEAPTLAAPHPLGPGDCAGGGWRHFTIPRFKDRRACESWVRERLGSDPGPRLFLFPAPDPSLPGPDRRSGLPLRA